MMMARAMTNGCVRLIGSPFLAFTVIAMALLERFSDADEDLIGVHALVLLDVLAAELAEVESTAGLARHPACTGGQLQLAHINSFSIT